MNALPRAAVENAIERLIAVLDAVDGDADMEPSLGVAGNDEDREPDGDELDYSECDDDLAGIFGLVAAGYSGAVSASTHRTRRTVKRQLARIVARRAATFSP